MAEPTRRETLEAELAALKTDTVPEDGGAWARLEPYGKPAVVMHSMTEEEEADVERIAIFELDERVFTIEKLPRIDLALEYLRLARKSGDNAAIAFLLEESLGEDAFIALSQHKGLKPSEFSTIFALVQKHVLGGLEGPKGR